ncbi:hypothetical protein HN422_04380 [archaeon]|nr:hypothetical protein [archaeon]
MKNIETRVEVSPNSGVEHDLEINQEVPGYVAILLPFLILGAVYGLYKAVLDMPNQIGKSMGLKRYQ